EWETLGRAHGCSVAMVRTLAEWLHEAHPLAAGTLVDTNDPLLGAVRVPGTAAQLSTTPAHDLTPRRRPGSDDAELKAALDKVVATPRTAREVTDDAAPAEPPLRGIRVLDFTRVAAAPTATKLLAQHGADVIKVDTDPTGQAMVPEPIGHDGVNRGKRSIRLD